MRALRSGGLRCGTALLLLTALLAACAVSEKQNRRLLNVLDAHVAPESDGARWALAPVAFPVGVIAFVGDAVLVHPACVFDDAWRDTVDWLWTPDPAESRFRRALITPLCALATPFVWVGDWLGRAIFAIPPHEAGA